MKFTLRTVRKFVILRLCMRRHGIDEWVHVLLLGTTAPRESIRQTYRNNCVSSYLFGSQIKKGQTKIDANLPLDNNTYAT